MFAYLEDVELGIRLRMAEHAARSRPNHSRGTSTARSGVRGSARKNERMGTAAGYIVWSTAVTQRSERCAGTSIDVVVYGPGRNRPQRRAVRGRARAPRNVPPPAPVRTTGFARVPVSPLPASAACAAGSGARTVCRLTAVAANGPVDRSSQRVTAAKRLTRDADALDREQLAVPGPRFWS